MRTLTIVCNFVLLGLIGVDFLTEGTPMDSDSWILLILAVTALIMNIFLIAGSTISARKIMPSEGHAIVRKLGWTFYLFVKILAIILNSVTIGILIIDNRHGNGAFFTFFKIFVILTFVLGGTMVGISKWNRFKDFRKTISVTGIALLVLITGTFISFRIIIGNVIKENIRLAKTEYPGKAEDALLAYLADTTNSSRDRTNVAIWTLGQIRSEKALPVLILLYNSELKGNLPRHDSELSRYELHKAIVSIENHWLGAKEKNIFGSWRRLNR